MTLGSLFSGIGGFELGLMASGLITEVAWQVENDEFCVSILEKNFGPIFREKDIRTFFPVRPVDVLCGGFPCQDVSDVSRGRGGGFRGRRSGLWGEMRRITDEIRPRWVIVENVAGAARKKWLPGVRSQLHGLGYASVPIQLRGYDVGAPFRGSRIFVAATNREGQPAIALSDALEKLPELVEASRKSWGPPPPRALGVPDGVPRLLDRCRVVGNAVMPAQAEVIGRYILEVEDQWTRT